MRCQVKIEWTTNDRTLGKSRTGAKTLCELTLWVSGISAAAIDKKVNVWFRKTVSFVSPTDSYEIIVRGQGGEVLSEVSRFAERTPADR